MKFFLTGSVVILQFVHMGAQVFCPFNSAPVPGHSACALDFSNTTQLKTFFRSTPFSITIRDNTIDVLSTALSNHYAFLEEAKQSGQ